MKSFSEIEIDKPDESIYSAARKNWDSVSKPIDGLGDFEELICRIAAIKGTEYPSLKKRAAVIMCADNGIVEEGISQSGSDITKSVAVALGSGISSACTLAGTAKVEVIPVDIGIDCDDSIPGVRDMKIRKGTQNFLKGPSMTREETCRAIEAGISLVKELSDSDYEMISTGEMGIGNTTTSAAVLSALLHMDSDALTGRGAGLDDEGLLRKKKVIKSAHEKYGFDENTDALTILSSVGGLDIAGLAGVFIGGALYHIPVVIDGVISATSAIIADKLVPGTRRYMIASHAGREKGCVAALNELGLSPYINGNMALGEGTGALMLFPILDMVLNYYKNGARFSDYKIDEYTRFER